MKKVILILLALIVVLLSGSYIGLHIWIKSDIVKYCKSAMNQYKGDEVEALISVLQSDTQSLTDKNHAIWTLEYIGDLRALPILKSLQTGQACNHRYYVCQRELNRAIAHVENKATSGMNFRLAAIHRKTKRE